jgi:hypothetical protein
MLLNGPAILSLALLALTLAAWVIGVVHPVTLNWAKRSDRAFFVHFDRGRIFFVEQRMFPPNPPGDYVLDATQFNLLKIRGASEGPVATIHFDPLSMAWNRFFSSAIAGVGVTHAPLRILLSSATGRFTGVKVAIRTAAVPYLILVIVFLIPLGIVLRMRRRDRLKAERGLCKVCGYDLRATPRRCPECGTVPPEQVFSGHVGDPPPQTIAENSPPASA